MFPIRICLIGCLISAISAAPTTLHGTATCPEIQVRKEWRDLTVEDRLSYIEAVKCLQSLPPNDPTRIATTRYEEFQATHIELTDRIHRVGHFLPWHRHLGTLYINAMRDSCGYKGSGAFWDWSRDADSNKPLAQSPVFDDVTGFGGDGVPGTYTLPPDPKNESSVPRPLAYRGCVQTGPFKDSKLRLGPGKLVTGSEHCLVRGINEDWRHSLVSSNVAETLKSPTFEHFRLSIDSLVNGIHGSGHFSVGGEMTNIYSAGADPLFYLHHMSLDRIWWKWQEASPGTRTYEISGPTQQNGSIPSTLDFVMDFPALSPNLTIRDVMDSRTSPSCFIYEY